MSYEYYKDVIDPPKNAAQPIPTKNNGQVVARTSGRVPATTPTNQSMTTGGTTGTKSKAWIVVLVIVVIVVVIVAGWLISRGAS